MSVLNVLLAGNAYDTIHPLGSAVFTSGGSYNWTVPAGVRSICILAVGAGGDAIYDPSTPVQSGGGSGSLAYYNNYPVNPGDVYTVFVSNTGNYGTSGITYPADGSYFANSTKVIIYAQSGYNGINYNAAGTYGGAPGGTSNGISGVVAYPGTYAGIVVYTTPFAGGAYGSGGAGAPGYLGYGGRGGQAQYNAFSEPSVGTGGTGTGGGGGGGGGGYIYTNTGTQGGGFAAGTGGGGVGLYGIGSSGTGGAPTYGGYSGSHVLGTPGTGGSGGANGTVVSNYVSGNGGNYGGGAGGVGDYVAGISKGGLGAVRIMWGNGKSFPYNAS
jgi:hypothetical protein